MPPFSFQDIPSQRGRVALITGANSGIGYEAALGLARVGASVVLACRTQEKAGWVAERIRAELEQAQVVAEQVDLADLDDVAAFAVRFRARYQRLDLLVNNAGVMTPPLAYTAQGHELQFGTNHLGHFALTGRLLPVLESTPDARIVVVTSIAQKLGRIDFDDLDWRRRVYDPWASYGQSKLANMMFVLELQRRLSRAGRAMKVVASHPGWTATQLQRTAPFYVRLLNPLIGMTPREGALTTLRAATDVEAEGGSYWGPTGLAGMIGPPGRATPCEAALRVDDAKRLFEVSEQLTGVFFDLPSSRSLQA